MSLYSRDATRAKNIQRDVLKIYNSKLRHFVYFTKMMMFIKYWPHINQITWDILLKGATYGTQQ